MSEQVSELMLSTAACFPYVELLESTASEWLKIWTKFAEKYGFARLEVAVNRLKFKLDFFPKPSEIQREIDSFIQEDRDAATKNTATFVSCGKCSIEGLIFVNARGEVCDGKTCEERFVKECDCRKAWLAMRKKRQDG